MTDAIHGDYTINAVMIKRVLALSTAQGLDRLVLIAIASAFIERTPDGTHYKMTVNTIARWTGMTLEECSAHIRTSKLFDEFDWTNGYDILIDYAKFMAALK